FLRPVPQNKLEGLSRSSIPSPISSLAGNVERKGRGAGLSGVIALKVWFLNRGQKQCPSINTFVGHRKQTDIRTAVGGAREEMPSPGWQRLIVPFKKISSGSVEVWAPDSPRIPVNSRTNHLYVLRGSCILENSTLSTTIRKSWSCEHHRRVLTTSTSFFCQNTMPPCVGKSVSSGGRHKRHQSSFLCVLIRHTQHSHHSRHFS
ncbi:unnamed protein product, partial [Ectocarpus fasciculatus]